MKAVGVLVLVACSSKPDPVPSPPTHTVAPVEHVESCPGVRAIWRGERDGTAELYDSFTLEVEGSARSWKRELDEASAGDKPYKLFSPDCKHVVLLQNALGPYHIVRLDRLAAYLGGAAPDYELAGEPDPSGVGRGTFRGASWISSREVTYVWGCCEPPNRTRFTLPER